MNSEKRTVAIPADYFFRMASREYTNWPLALAREFIQNSVDAGATQIDITTEDGWLFVSDNGSGMTAQILTDVLLTLGGSKKDGNATGGFGKAKELLFFSWPEWYIHSQDNFVSGEGSEYTITTTPYRSGTLVRCDLGIANAARFTAAVGSYVCNCIVNPSVSITLNGEDLTSSMVDPGTLTSRGVVEGLGEVFEQTGSQDLTSGVYVTINGLYMFYSSAANNSTFFIVLAGKSYDLLTANRDGFNSDTRPHFDKVIRKLATDNVSAKFQQSWQILLARPRRQVQSQVSMSARGSSQSESFTSTVSGLDSSPTQQYEQPEPEYIEGEMGQEQISAQLVDPLVTPQFSRVLKSYNNLFQEGWIFLSNEPFTKEEIDFFGKKSTQYHAIVWQAVVRHVAQANNLFLDFGLGFVKSPSTEAAHFSGYILLNPNAYRDLPNNKMVLRMVTAAAEELTHLEGYPYHNETFKLRYTQMLETSLDSFFNHREFIRLANAKSAFI